jgi:hypothetical protein
MAKAKRSIDHDGHKSGIQRFHVFGLHHSRCKQKNKTAIHVFMQQFSDTCSAGALAARATHELEDGRQGMARQGSKMSRRAT